MLVLPKQNFYSTQQPRHYSLKSMDFITPPGHRMLPLLWVPPSRLPGDPSSSIGKICSYMIPPLQNGPCVRVPRETKPAGGYVYMFVCNVRIHVHISTHMHTYIIIIMPNWFTWLWNLGSPKSVVWADRLEVQESWCSSHWNGCRSSPKGVCWRILPCSGRLLVFLFCLGLPADWMRPTEAMEDTV